MPLVDWGTLFETVYRQLPTHEDDLEAWQWSIRYHKDMRVGERYFTMFEPA